MDLQWEVCCVTQELRQGSVTTSRVRWGGRWEEGSRGRVYLYLWLTHVAIWQKPTQYYCKQFSAN